MSGFIRAAHKYHPSVPKKQLAQRARSEGSLTKLNPWRSLENCLLSHLHPHLQLVGFEGGCVFQFVKKRSVPVLKGKPGAVFDRAGGHQEGQLPCKWFSRWVWHWVPACTLTPLTVFSPVYSTFSRDGFVDCFSGCCFDSR